MAFRKSFLIAAIIGFVWLIIFQNIQAKPVSAFSAGHIGNNAGLLAAGQALNELYAKQNERAQFIADESDEGHDFSEGAAKNNPSLYESLGSLGDHLKEQEFPKDYGQDEEKATEYEEAEAQAAEASEQHDAAEHAQFEHETQTLHENEVDFGSDLHSHDFDDFYSKPVPGIDHGKGAYSYSTTYEFKEPKA